MSISERARNHGWREDDDYNASTGLHRNPRAFGNVSQGPPDVYARARVRRRRDLSAGR